MWRVERKNWYHPWKPWHWVVKDELKNPYPVTFHGSTWTQSAALEQVDRTIYFLFRLQNGTPLDKSL